MRQIAIAAPFWLASVPAHAASIGPLRHALEGVLLLISALVALYALRHYLFTVNRLFAEQRHPYVDIDCATWPALTVLVAAHNEEAVIGDALQALLEADYPADRLCIMPVNDRSTDRTAAIIDDLAARHPGRIVPYHRHGGPPGKAAALRDATERVSTPVLLVFDADYLPARGLLKQLAAPFFDPEVGAVMGRVVPINVERNLLTRLLDLERAGGYQVDQQARMNLGLVPQYGGTVGGVRRAALNAIGGWHADVLAEDTDVTFRLLLAGWKTVYQNRCECHEEVPETWPVRVRQIRRWAMGHNQALWRHGRSLLAAKHLGLLVRLDGLLLLGTFAMAPLLLLGWSLAQALYYAGDGTGAALFAGQLALVAFGTFGNFAAFFEIAAAVYLDGARGRLKLLPFNALGFLVSTVTVSLATSGQVWAALRGRRALVWDKTARFRKAR